MKQKDKTNVMRKLDQVKICYTMHSYPNDKAYSGTEVAEMLGEDVDKVFKTLVTIGSSRTHYVFMIPVAKELDLKKAAKHVNEKSVAMILTKELLPLTGYVHGGCSPIGMKKRFKVSVDNSALQQDTIIFSAGKIGYQVELVLAELKKVIDFTTAELTH